MAHWPQQQECILEDFAGEGAAAAAQAPCVPTAESAKAIRARTQAVELAASRAASAAGLQGGAVLSRRQGALASLVGMPIAALAPPPSISSSSQDAGMAGRLPPYLASELSSLNLSRAFLAPTTAATLECLAVTRATLEAGPPDTPPAPDPLWAAAVAAFPTLPSECTARGYLFEAIPCSPSLRPPPSTTSSSSSSSSSSTTSTTYSM